MTIKDRLRKWLGVDVVDVRTNGLSTRIEEVAGIEKAHHDGLITSYNLTYNDIESLRADLKTLQADLKKAEQAVVDAKGAAIQGDIKVLRAAINAADEMMKIANGRTDRVAEYINEVVQALGSGSN